VLTRCCYFFTSILALLRGHICRDSRASALVLVRLSFAWGSMEDSRRCSSALPREPFDTIRDLVRLAQMHILSRCRCDVVGDGDGVERL